MAPAAGPERTEVVAVENGLVEAFGDPEATRTQEMEVVEDSNYAHHSHLYETDVAEKLPLEPEPKEDGWFDRFMASEFMNKDVSCWIWDEDSLFRMKVANFLTSRVYNFGITTMILINTIVLILAIAMPDTGGMQQFALIFDCISVGVYCLGIWLQIVARCLWGPPGAMAESPAFWAIAVMLFVAITALSTGQYGVTVLLLYPFITVLDQLSYPWLRPFRTFSLTAQYAFTLMAQSCAFILCLLCFFAVAGMQFYQNSFNRECIVDDGSNNYTTYISMMPQQGCKTSEDCGPGFLCYDKAKAPNDGWTDFTYFPQSCLLMFQVLTLSDWSSFMTRLHEAEEEITWYSTSAFFVVYILLMSYLVLNMFIAVFVISYQHQQENEVDPLHRKSLEPSHDQTPRNLVTPRRSTLSPMDDVNIRRPSCEGSRKGSVEGSRDGSHTHRSGAHTHRSGAHTHRGSRRPSLAPALLSLESAETSFDLTNRTQPDEVVPASGRNTPGSPSGTRRISSNSLIPTVPSAVPPIPIPPTEPGSSITTGRRAEVVDAESEAESELEGWRAHWHNRYWQGFLHGMTLVNMLIMCTRTSREGPLSHGMDVVEVVFLFWFVVELLLATICLGTRSWIRNPWMFADAAAIAISILCSPLFFLAYGINLSALRATRTVWLLRDVPQLHTLRRVMDIASKGIIPVVVFCVHILFTLLVFAILGMALFRGKFRIASGQYKATRMHFNTFPDAYSTVFLIMTGDDWQLPCYEAMEVKGAFYALYFLAFFGITNYILLNVFLTLVLATFDLSPEYVKEVALRKSAGKEKKNLPEYLREYLDILEHVSLNMSKAIGNPSHQNLVEWRLEEARQQRRLNPFLNSARNDDKSHLSINLGRRRDWHLFLFPPDSKWVTKARMLEKENAYWRWFFVLITMISTFSIAYEEPPSADVTQATYTWPLLVLDLIVQLCFTVEFVVKCVSRGFLFQKGAYLTSGWNMVDFSLLVTQFMVLIAVAADGLGSVFGGYLRMLLCLRVLRLVTRLTTIKDIVAALWQSVPAMLLITLISFFFYTQFALLGMQTLSGRFAYCTDYNAAGQSDCIATYVKNDLLYPASWKNKRANFDHLFNSLGLLLEVASLAGWASLALYPSLDAGAVGTQPIQDQNSMYIFYFGAFVVLGSYYFVNLYIGIIIEYIEFERGAAFLTDLQVEWVKAKRALKQTTPDFDSLKPQTVNHSRLFCYRITISKWFNNIVLIAISVNAILLALTGVLNEWVDWVLLCIIVVIFAVEATLKLIAFGPKRYFFNGWNLFDLIVVIGSILGLIFQHTDHIFLEGWVKCMRLARTFKLVKHVHFLRTFVLTFWTVMPEVVNITAVLILCLMSYSYVGKRIFGAIKDQMVIGSKINFRHFRTSLLALFQILTLDNWNFIAADCYVGPKFGECTVIEGVWNDCGNEFGGMIYFVSFYIVMAYILLNVIVGMVLANFEVAYEGEHEEALVSVHDIEAFQETWNEFDATGSGVIPTYQLRPFLRLLYQRTSRSLHLNPDMNTILFYLPLEHSLQVTTSLIERAKGRRGGGDKYYTFRNVLIALARITIASESLSAGERKQYVEALDVIAVGKLQSWVRGVFARAKMRDKFTYMTSRLKRQKATLDPNRKTIKLDANSLIQAPSPYKGPTTKVGLSGPPPSTSIKRKAVPLSRSPLAPLSPPQPKKQRGPPVTRTAPNLDSESHHPQAVPSTVQVSNFSDGSDIPGDK